MDVLYRTVIVAWRLWLQRVCGVLGRKCRAVHEELAWPHPTQLRRGLEQMVPSPGCFPAHPLCPCSEHISAWWSITRLSGDTWQLSLVLAPGWTQPKIGITMSAWFETLGPCVTSLISVLRKIWGSNSLVHPCRGSPGQCWGVQGALWLHIVWLCCEMYERHLGSLTGEMGKRILSQTCNITWAICFYKSLDCLK